MNGTIDMAVDLSGMRLPNPLMTASGCAANGRELQRFFDISELGAFVTKTVLADPRSGAAGQARRRRVRGRCAARRYSRW